MKKLWFAIMLGILLASCTNQPADELVLPTRIHTPTQTATPVPTATPTALVLADHGDQTEPYPGLEVITAENVHRLEEVDVWGQGTVLGIALSPDASTIAVSTPTGIYFYDAETLEQVDWIDFYVEREGCQFGICGYTYDNLDYSSDGKSLLIGFDDLYSVDLVTKKVSCIETKEVKKEYDYILEVTYSKDYSKILFTKANLKIYGTEILFIIFDVESEKILLQYDFQSTDFAARIYQSENDEVFMGPIIVDSRNGNIIKEAENILPDAVDQVFTSKLIADNQWQMNLPQKEITCVFQENIGEAFSWGMNDISEDGLILITLEEYQTASLYIWDLNQCRKAEQSVFLPDASSYISFSPNGNYLISSSFGDMDRYVWDVYSTKVIKTIHADWLRFDTYESELISMKDIHSSTDGICTSIIEDVFAGVKLLEVDGCLFHQFVVNPVNSNIFFLDDKLYNVSQSDVLVKEYSEYPHQFSPDGKYVAYLVKQSSNRNAFLYFDSVMDGSINPSETKRIPILLSSPLNNSVIEDFFISTSGRYIVLYDRDELLIWDFLDGKFLSIAEDADQIESFQFIFFPGDKLLLTRKNRYEASNLDIWNLETEQVISQFTLPYYWSSGPVISPDGKLMAFLGYDGTIRIYGVRSETK